MRRHAGRSMLDLFDPRIDILPAAQQEVWPQLGHAASLSFVLYGGTAIALHLGHRTSVDFFRSEPLGRTGSSAVFDSSKGRGRFRKMCFGPRGTACPTYPRSGC